MITLNVRSNIQEVGARLTDRMRKQVPFAASRAINEMAFDTREMVKDLMGKTYEGGAVNYTKNAIYSSKSTKRDLSAFVYVGGTDQHRINYVLNTIMGGTAPKRSKAQFSPNKKIVRLTKVGHNMPRGYVKRNVAKEGHFILHAGKGKPGGLYRRVKDGKGTKLELLVAFDDNQVNKASLPAKSASAAFVKKHFNSIFFRMLRQAMATAK
jgi:hypothetical protein